MIDKLLLLIILLVIANFIISETLKYVNNKRRSIPIPETLKDIYSTEKYIKYLSYKKETYNFSIITATISLIFLIAMLLAGFAILEGWVSNLVDIEILRSLLYIGILGYTADIISLPFDLHETFNIEQKYGFNTSTVKTFIYDKLKSWMLALFVGGPILYLVIWLYSRFESDFWWMVWIVISALTVVISLSYSNVIVPLFNKQTPLEEGPLKDKIKELALTTGFNLANVYVIDGSKRSTRANAYFTGFGSKKRIVLYDTLINTQSIEEILSVLAHEIGHYKKKHTITGLVLSVLQMGILLYIFSLVIDSKLLYEALGTEPSFHIGAIVFMILYSPVSFMFSLGVNYISRIHEYQADKYASENSSAISLVSALKSLASNNMSDLNPHPYYVIAYYSHPPLVQRIERLTNHF